MKRIENKSVFIFSDHINYIRSLIGVDHVGIGADYNGVDT